MIKHLTTENPNPQSATSDAHGVIVRRAEMRDVDAIHELIVAATRVSMVLPRDRDSILHHLQGFRVAESEGRVVGCGVLHVMAPVLGEIRSLAVESSAQRRGVGRRIVASLIGAARGLGIKRVFVLTDRPEVFVRYGFNPCSMETLPEKVWNDCLHCPKYHNCGEVALDMLLNADEN